MSDIRVVPLENTKRNIRKFVKFAWRIYKDDPHWVPPLIFDSVFRIHKGPYHETGVIQPFMAYRDGEPVGRIIAHYDNYHNSYFNTRRGAVGFFECVDDTEVSRSLFRAAENWLAAQGMTEMYGPQNFLVYDASGLVVDNFQDDPVVECSYNPPYYERLFLDYGFVKDIDWYAFRIDSDVLIPESFLNIWKQVMNNQEGLTFRNTVISRWNKKASLEEGKRFLEAFNRAWANNWGHLPVRESYISYLVDFGRWIGIPELVIIAEHKGRMAGFVYNIPDVNQALKSANGRLFPFGIFKILRGLRKINRIRVAMTGILPEYRLSGMLELCLYLETKSRGDRRGIKSYDFSLIVEKNSGACRGLYGVGGKRYKTFRFYTRPITASEATRHTSSRVS